MWQGLGLSSSAQYILLMALTANAMLPRVVKHSHSAGRCCYYVFNCSIIQRMQRVHNHAKKKDVSKKLHIIIIGNNNAIHLGKFTTHVKCQCSVSRLVDAVT